MLQLNTFFGVVLSTATLLINSLAYANEPITINVQDNKVEAVIELPGNIEADITLQFEQAIGLTKESIGISAQLIDISDINFLQRLPNNLTISPASAFPMMITIEPLANSGFAFSGVGSIDIHTHNLEYTTNTPLRFFKAPLNGNFRDITETMGAGSYRARGRMGRFSQFIIVADLRDPLAVATKKFNTLQTALTNFSAQIDAAVYSQLVSDINEVNRLMSIQDYTAASGQLNLFKRHINQNSGIKIPNVWRSSRDIDNVAGELIAYASTLRFSLRLIK